MKDVSLTLILLIICCSCSDSKPEEPQEKTATEITNDLVDPSPEIIKDIPPSLESYLIISGLSENWPSKYGERKEINWVTDTITQRYSRKYFQLDTLIKGRRVFADSLRQQFFFYFPYKKCWVLHTKYPDSDVLNELKKEVSNNFKDLISKKEYYRFGFEYGQTDSWNLEKLVFSKAPWNYSTNESLIETYNIPTLYYDKKSLYQVKWIGEDPMMELKDKWNTIKKTLLHQDWVIAYEKYINAPEKELFIPKPIPIDYQSHGNDVIQDFADYSLLLTYLMDQYGVTDSIIETNDVILSKDNFNSFGTIKANGDSVLQYGYSYGFDLPIKSTRDSIILPWVVSTSIVYGSKITQVNDYMSFDRMMADKMWEGGTGFTLPKADPKYLMVLLEFLFDKTFIPYMNEGEEEFRERIYTMPEDPMREIPLETGCWFNVSAYGISFECDMGGC